MALTGQKFISNWCKVSWWYFWSVRSLPKKWFRGSSCCFYLMVLLFFNFCLLRSPWVWICNQQMGQNRSLMCRKMLIGWAWKQYNHFSPHFINQWTHPLVPQSLLTTGALGYLFSLCAQEKEMSLVSSLSIFTITLHQGTIVGWDNSGEVLTGRPARIQVCA